jgi:hypothetical protein
MSASQRRIPDATNVVNRSNVESLITFSNFEVAVCCSNAQFVGEPNSLSLFASSG